MVYIKQALKIENLLNKSFHFPYISRFLLQICVCVRTSKCIKQRIIIIIIIGKCEHKIIHFVYYLYAPSHSLLFSSCYLHIFVCVPYATSHSYNVIFQTCSICVSLTVHWSQFKFSFHAPSSKHALHIYTLLLVLLLLPLTHSVCMCINIFNKTNSTIYQLKRDERESKSNLFFVMCSLTLSPFVQKFTAIWNLMLLKWTWK